MEGSSELYLDLTASHAVRKISATATATATAKATATATATGTATLPSKA